MHILVSNDDGYDAPGIKVLADALADMGTVTVVAPDRNRSGASNSLTLDRPLSVSQAANGYTFVDGTPTDCVHLAITGLLESEPDLVVSGINAGGNLGDDILYSGTVAAAMEGRFLGLPAMAVSLVGSQPTHYATAAKVVLSLLESMPRAGLAPEVILNINVPDVPWEALTGIHATRLGFRHKAEPVIKDTNPGGDTVYWVGPPGQEQDAGEGTDFYAVRHGAVSVTPIHTDLTRYSTLDTVSAWLQTLS